MKKTMILHINDGNSEVVKNKGKMFVETFPYAQEILEQLIHDGWEVRQMIPEVTPAINKEGVYSFYKSGFTIYLERDVS